MRALQGRSLYGRAYPCRGRDEAFGSADCQAQGGRSGRARSTEDSTCWSNGTVMEGSADSGSTAANEDIMDTHEPQLAQVAHLPD